jgi:hypothetical protein
MQRSGAGPEFSGEGNRLRYEPDALKKWVIDTFCVSPARLDL